MGFEAFECCYLKIAGAGGGRYWEFGFVQEYDCLLAVLRIEVVMEVSCSVLVYSVDRESAALDPETGAEVRSRACLQRLVGATAYVASFVAAAVESSVQNAFGSLP